MADIPAAFKATVHGFRTVPTRKVVQITIEAPIEQHSVIAAIAEHGAWVGVARIQTPEEAPSPSQSTAGAIKERRPWSELTPTTQACIRCTEPIFQGWVIAQGFHEVEDDKEKNAACYVRKECGVNTRSALSTNKVAAAHWRSLENRFLSDQQAERVLG